MHASGAQERSIEEKVIRAVARSSPDRQRMVAVTDRLVDDLGFDSIRIANLSVEIEHELGEPILLNDWVGSAGDPALLTVASLVDFVRNAMA
jgi:acyl carrier protein